MNDQRYFDAVAQEQRENKLNEGMWNKAMAASENDRIRARAAYVTFRVEQLKQLHDQQLKVLRFARKPFCTCPACDCAGPFPTRLWKKLGFLLCLLPLSGFYFMGEGLLEDLEKIWAYRSIPDSIDLPTLLMCLFGFTMPVFVFIIVSRGAVKCPSCGHPFWYRGNAPEGNTILKSL